MTTRRKQRKQKFKGDELNEEQSRKDQLAKFCLPSFYTEKLASFDPRFLQKLISSNEECKLFTPSIFDMLPQRGNQLSFLYHKRGDLEEARKWNADILKDYPDNIMALDIKFHLCLNEKNISEMDMVLNRLQTMSHDVKAREELIAKAELAFFYSHLYPKMYKNAIMMYREVLHIPEKMAQTPQNEQYKLNGLLDQKHQLIYRLDLAMTYNKLMNQDNVRLNGEEEINEAHIQHCFDCIFHLLNHSIQDAETALQQGEQDRESSETLKIILGKSWIEYGLAYKKYETSMIKKEHRKPYLPPGMSTMNIDKCYIKGQEISPDDIDILEKYAIHLRHRACDEKHHLEAIKLFDKVLAINPCRHVSLHHKALCYKEAWYEACELDERKLKNNSPRKDKKMHQGRKKKHTNTYTEVLYQRPDAKNPEAEVSSKDGELSFSKEEPIYQSSSDSKSAPSTPTDKQKYSYQRSVSQPSHLPTLYPQRPPLPGKLPKHKEPSFFDKLRVSNPRDKTPDKPHHYLQQAEECLRKAVEVSAETSTRYLLDLARVLICLRKYKEAQKYFEKGSDEKNMFNNKDAAYLYEQWALLKDEISEKVKEQEVENIKHLYRKAVTCAVRARERSKMAYYKLRDIIEWQLQKNTGTSDKTLKKELGLLHHTIEEFDKAKFTFLELLDKDPESIDIMWDLVKTFNETGRFADAFGYIVTIYEHLKTQNSDAVNNMSPEHKYLIFNVALNKVENEEQDATTNTLQTLFGMLTLSQDQQREGRIAALNVSDQIPEEFDITRSDVLVMASDYNHPTVTLLKCVLQKRCGLEVFWHTTDDCFDNCIPVGMYIAAAAEFALKRTKTLIIVSETIRTDPELSSLVDMVLSVTDIISTISVCIVMSKSEKEEELPASLRRFNKVKINEALLLNNTEETVQNEMLPSTEHLAENSTQKEIMKLTEELLDVLLLQPQSHDES